MVWAREVPNPTRPVIPAAKMPIIAPVINESSLEDFATVSAIASHHSAISPKHIRAIRMAMTSKLMRTGKMLNQRTSSTIRLSFTISADYG